MEALFEQYDPYFLNELDMAINEAATVRNLNFLVLFEANEPINANTLQQNEEKKNGVFAHIGNAIESLRKMIASMLSRISDWFQKLFMGDKEKKLYNRVVEACKQVPELANKKITVTDFRQARQKYLSIMNQVEEAQKNGNQSEVDKLLSQIKDGFSGAFQGVTVSVGMQAALNIAHSNREMAAQISQQLQNDSKIMDMIANAVGQKEANKFQKEIETYTKECKIRRTILGLRGKMFSNVADATQDIFNSVEQAIDFNNSSGATKVVKGMKMIGNKTTTDLAGRMMKNDQINGAVKSGVGIYRDITGAKKQAEKDQARWAKQAAKTQREISKGNMTNASSAQFMMDGLDKAGDKLFSMLGK